MELLGGVTYVGIDSETDLIRPQNLAPKLICVSTSVYTGEGFENDLLGNGDPELESALRSLLEDPTIHLVGAKISYDMAVFYFAFPALQPLIWQAYEQERIHCTVAREKVLNLSDHGRLKLKPMPDGSHVKISYSLNALGIEYLGRDRSAEKEGDDIWRTNYASLDGKRAAEYPPEAAQYAMDDAQEALEVFYAQQHRQLAPTGPVSLNTSEFQAAVDFALWLISIYGMRIDPVAKDKIAVELEEVCKPDNLPLLVGAGILRPGEPPRPYKRAGGPKIEVNLDGMDTAAKRNMLSGCWTELGKPERIEFTEGGRIVASQATFKRLYQAVPKGNVQHGINVQAFLARVTVLEDSNDGKMTKAKAPSIDKKKLESLVAQMRTRAGLPVIYSNPDAPEDERNVSCTADIIAEIVHLSPVLEEYQKRQEVQKIVTTELPRMGYPDGRTADVAHPVFDVLKETTRTSSYAGGTRSDGQFIFPSFNGQNVDPRVRPCYIPRDGWLILSIDYSSIELVSAAHRQLDLFGQSKLADLLLQGVDLHGWMGGQLAYALNDEFRASFDSQGQVAHLDQEMAIYEVFNRMKTDQREEVVEFWKHWRKFAKPVDLGFPGGLGADTFVAFAKSYGVEVTPEAAKMLKEIWLRCLPEYRLGFDFINNQCKDPRWPIVATDKSGNAIQGYAYTTPMGAYRSACVYTSACNGNFLQSPTAEGAKLAVFDTVRRCWDPTFRGKAWAFGCRPIDFIHDEILFEIPEDGYEHERAYELASVMEQSMSLVFPRLPIKAEPALSRRWYKEADLVLDDRGRLAVWEPKS